MKCRYTVRSFDYNEEESWLDTNDREKAFAEFDKSTLDNGKRKATITANDNGKIIAKHEKHKHHTTTELFVDR